MFFVSLFYFSLTYFFAFLTKSVPITLMVLIVYDIVNCILWIRIKNVFLLYCNLEPFSQSDIYINLLPMFLLSIALIFAGVFLNKRISKFN